MRGAILERILDHHHAVRSFAVRCGKGGRDPCAFRIDDATRVESTTIEDNHVPHVFYTDVTAGLSLEPSFHFFATVNTLFERTR